MLSKTFDNGMICASEQAVIVDECLADDFERIMKENNCYFLNKEETKRFPTMLSIRRSRRLIPL